MKYHSLVVAGTLALGGLAGAAQDSTPSGQQTDDRVECIEMAVADELEGDQKDAFVKQCMEQKTAERTKANDKNG